MRNIGSILTTKDYVGEFKLNSYAQNSKQYGHQMCLDKKFSKVLPHTDWNMALKCLCLTKPKLFQYKEYFYVEHFWSFIRPVNRIMREEQKVKTS